MSHNLRLALSRVQEVLGGSRFATRTPRAKLPCGRTVKPHRTPGAFERAMPGSCSLRCPDGYPAGVPPPYLGLAERGVGMSDHIQATDTARKLGLIGGGLFLLWLGILFVGASVPELAFSASV